MTTATSNQAPEHTIHLQAIGRVRAKPASEIAVGDVLVWNFGMRTLVEGVREVSKCYLEVAELSEESGGRTTRRMKRDRLVGLSRLPWRGTRDEQRASKAAAGG